MQDYLCPGLLTHNIVVLLIGLCHKMTEVYLTWINNIEDPMMRFTEFLLRSTLFRSIVLSLEVLFLIHLG